MKEETTANRDELIKQNAYFKNRGMDPNYYLSFQLPQYLKDELPIDKAAPILDIGCGFGQMLLRIKDAGHSNIEGVDIGNESVDFCKNAGLKVSLISSIEDYAEKNTGKCSHHH